MAARRPRPMVAVSPWLTVSISFLGIVLIPLTALLWRVAVSVTREHDKMTEIEEDIQKLVDDKDRTHAAIIEQMREDRTATNQRLRWLEENVWNTQRQKP